MNTGEIDGMVKVLADVEYERFRQHEKWGQQNHHPERWLTILVEEVGEVAKATLNEGNIPPEISLEEIRQELIHVAAVAVAAAESIDRNSY